jgi:hypothetical protein
VSVTLPTYCSAVRGSRGVPEKHSVTLTPKFPSSCTLSCIMGIWLNLPVVQVSPAAWAGWSVDYQACHTGATFALHAL